MQHSMLTSAHSGVTVVKPAPSHGSRSITGVQPSCFTLQVAELQTAAAAAERSHRAQLDAVLQDAAAHEAAAVSAAVAVTAAHLTRGTGLLSCCHICNEQMGSATVRPVAHTGARA
jgi:hypothetical protein